MKKEKINISLLIISIISILSLGMYSALFTGNAKQYYHLLKLPFFAPPAWVFGPVWTILYIMIGMTLYTIIRFQNTKYKIIFIILFSIQMLLNVLWSFLFFGLKNTFFSVLDISLLWILLIFFEYYLFKYIKIAFFLMLPYVLWVSFAMILNYAVYFLN